jgi:hypothetical protein
LECNAKPPSTYPTTLPSALIFRESAHWLTLLGPPYPAPMGCVVVMGCSTLYNLIEKIVWFNV